MQRRCEVEILMLELGGRCTNHHDLEGKLFSLEVHKAVTLTKQA